MTQQEADVAGGRRGEREADAEDQDVVTRSPWPIYAVAVVAYLLHVGALTLAPLSLVQAVLSGGIVLLGVFAERLFGEELGRRQWAGIILAAVGLSFLAVTGGTREGQESANYSVAAMLAFESALVAVGVALLLSFPATARAPVARESCLRSPPASCSR